MTAGKENSGSAAREEKPRLPGAVVIGAPKSGTTSLYHYLRQHPALFLPQRKELHYFTADLLAKAVNGPGDKDTAARICQTRDEYEAYFAEADAGQTAVEVSPSYLYFHEAGTRIAAELGPVRIIALLRNPLHKAFSQYMHLLRKGRETLPFYEALQAEEARRHQGWGDMWRYAESSLYAPGIARYLEIFGSKRVLTLQSEMFFRDPLTSTRQLFCFLGVDEHFAPDTSQVHNQSYAPRSRRAASWIRKGGGRLRLLLPLRLRAGARRRLEQLNAGDTPPPDPRATAYLRDYFAADVRETERLLGWRTGWLD